MITRATPGASSPRAGLSVLLEEGPMVEQQVQGGSVPQLEDDLGRPIAQLPPTNAS